MSVATETDFYSAYGELARRVDDCIVAAGRHHFQADAVELIAADVAAKMALKPEHRLLEIGFGSGPDGIMAK